MLPQIDIAGQEELAAARVLVVGLGGLGSPVALYLAAAGVGHLVLSDGDEVDITNLQRQIIHRTDALKSMKTESAAATLQAVNPLPKLELISEKLTGARLAAEVEKSDVVVDASDNFATRYALNEACFNSETPLVSGAAIRMEGQVSVFHSTRDSGCYRCLYPEGEAADELCSESGVLGPVVGVIGSIQATEAIKLILGIGRSLQGRLLLLDAMEMQFRTINLRRDPRCPVCGKER